MSLPLRLVRTLIASALVVFGAIVLTEMLHYPLRYAISGIVLGAAMIALGVLRLRALYGRRDRL